ncbi:TRAP transporter small permease [Hydrogenophaga taeniospiralis]|uniref:TRAP transporter small permease subunit n=1 Tax=Hydrogenophaga taeniospiralis TaxID=65656 RepID=UPI001CF95451|nr:TRAP transporter small permease [Hydrogenophaga taeniospiralis]MCB4365519.1 TRAP transporter small permease [Hydrogenophaga taeniospiralis]
MGAPSRVEAFENLDFDSADADAFSPDEGLAATVCRWISQWIVVGLVVMMGAEMLVRSAFGWSIQFSNEVGGYALVAIAFLSLGSGQLMHAYHRVHFVENRLSPAGRARLRLGFDLAALVVALVLFGEFARFEWITWKSEDVAATSLMTPLWVPRLAMPVGALVLTWALLRTVAADWRRLRAVSGNKGV